MVGVEVFLNKQGQKGGDTASEAKEGNTASVDGEKQEGVPPIEDQEVPVGDENGSSANGTKPVSST